MWSPGKSRVIEWGDNGGREGGTERMIKRKEMRKGSSSKNETE